MHEYIYDNLMLNNTLEFKDINTELRSIITAEQDNIIVNLFNILIEKESPIYVPDYFQTEKIKRGKLKNDKNYNKKYYQRIFNASITSKKDSNKTKFYLIPNSDISVDDSENKRNNSMAAEIVEFHNGIYESKYTLKYMSDLNNKYHLKSPLRLTSLNYQYNEENHRNYLEVNSYMWQLIYFLGLVKANQNKQSYIKIHIKTNNNLFYFTNNQFNKQTSYDCKHNVNDNECPTLTAIPYGSIMYCIATKCEPYIKLYNFLVRNNEFEEINNLFYNNDRHDSKMNNNSMSVIIKEDLDFSTMFNNN